MYVVADAAYLYYFATCGIHQLSYVGMNAVSSLSRIGELVVLMWKIKCM